jgi:transposase-like protein
MQILHPFAGDLHEYEKELEDPDRWRPSSCPLCAGKKPLVAHGFYRRTLVEEGFDGTLRVRRYLCRACRRTVSLLPVFVLPYRRFGLGMVARFLKARLVEGRTLQASAQVLGLSYQLGQQWIRRFRDQAAAVAAALAGLIRPPPAADFPSRALAMLERIGWREAHRFLFGELRLDWLGRARSQIPDPQ